MDRDKLSVYGWNIFIFPHHFLEKVFRVFPQNYKQVELIRSLANSAKLDFWVPDHVDLVEPGRRVDFRAESHVSYDIQALLQQNEIPFEIMIDDLQEALDKQRDSNIRAVHSYEKYNNLDTINAWGANLAAQYPGLVSRSAIGNSYEGRPIYLLKVGKSGANKRAVFIDCGFHAREWITPAFCQWFVKEAVNSYGTDTQFTNLLNNLDFYVLPVMNVDGYVYSWNTNRMWRKTRSANKNSNCIGTDPNRNFNAGWCTVGASSRACDDTYCGSSPESELESKAVANFIRANIPSIKAYLTIHSYSQMLLFPYSYSYSLAKDHTELNNVAKGAVAALTGLYGTKYTYGPGGKTIYLAAGGSDDWAYDAGVKYSYTFELRDTGRYGFALPESQIKATCEETLLAVKYIANHVLNNS
ncbi:carboxypeptidase B isoform X2 [Hyla sarda]|uniref:carboxypeptidase B isoform X2 n=1 Tax=Hyla sarda TaxID=327740 RepID=UPI0024C4664D|nr:carboxypeptidase B isoform X2 [Hyla sarda]